MFEATDGYCEIQSGELLELNTVDEFAVAFRRVADDPNDVGYDDQPGSSRWPGWYIWNVKPLTPAAKDFWRGLGRKL